MDISDPRSYGRKYYSETWILGCVLCGGKKFVPALVTLLLDTGNVLQWAPTDRYVLFSGTDAFLLCVSLEDISFHNIDEVALICFVRAVIFTMILQTAKHFH
jgi:hypothetical protein